MKTQEPELLTPEGQPAKPSFPHLKPTETKLAKFEGGAVDVRRPESQALSIEQVFQAVIDKQISPENVAVMRELLAMSAERKFAEAFSALQADLPTIVATSIIPNRGKYERFEDLMRQISPALTKHGFSVSFSNDFKENRILETCHLTHIGGHTRSNSFAVRVGKGDSETQADCKAATTAKRNALCNALNLVIRQDVLDEEHDATIEGDPNAYVTPAQADEIERRVKETNSSVSAFLSFAGAKKFSEIPASRYKEIDTMLRIKESKGK